MKFLRIFLFPVSLIYGVVVICRNFLYDTGFFKSQSFEHPILSVGNLAVGGAGKSPVTELLVRNLKDKYKISTLSRGYGRRTKGYLEVQEDHQADETGDEPLQFKHKFPEINVAVCEERVEGISRLMGKSDVIIMDDAYQHRAVKPGLSILLFDYQQLLNWQFVLPTGNLREPLWGMNRADVILITKGPKNITSEQERHVKKRLKLNLAKPLFFSSLDYGELISMHDQSTLSLRALKTSSQLVVITGIANTVPLMEKLEEYSSNIVHHKYPDHHTFSTKNITKLAETFNQIKDDDKLIITTEKDVQRLRAPELQKLIAELPVYYLPVSVSIKNVEQFNQIIYAHVAKYT